jgi:broad specificity phosphatase PhoE
MEITLIRHLPTEWNKNQILQGRRDIPLLPLTEENQKEITTNLTQLKEKSFDFILCSSLRRTKQTAELYGYSPDTELLLDELDFGPFEGKSRDELLSVHGKKWMETPKDLILGESLSNLEKRIIAFLDKYKEAENVLVFGHGSWMRAMKSYYRHGHINHMNKTIVKNNECLTLEFLTVEA